MSRENCIGIVRHGSELIQDCPTCCSYSLCSYWLRAYSLVLLGQTLSVLVGGHVFHNVARLMQFCMSAFYIHMTLYKV